MTRTDPARRPVALLLPGQGSQYARMGAGLYGHEPVFTRAVEAVFTAMGPLGDRLRADWRAGEPTVPLDHVTRSQPLLFAVDYAVGRVLLDRGVRPVALLGHSIGELAAATIAGVFTLADAARVVADRVTRLADGPPGGMLAAAATPERLAPFLGDGVVVGALNAPRQTVLAGPAEALAAVGEKLRADGITWRRVPSLSPFHSPVLAEAARGADAVFAAIRPRSPRIPVYSAYTGAVLSASDVADPAFWAGQPVAPVLFWPALDALLSTGDHLLVETGPGAGLTTLARRHPAVRAGGTEVLCTLPPAPGPAAADRTALASALSRLHTVGAAG
ncbi:acyltransferase domain-containing protein [Virgisporangium aurantiacum]|uniref:Malonyl-CoA:ACP transacylase (MAT) domain-containing protein n=1 Tax=Virgisporangium aurantiacum TaxID=175570 RepID=A0A8J3ZFI1_9ACTN|nr:acyltransferase domain-containing protein [Virgisporangium aurantiacum]GIJ60398.1 hypothetical protein Vau01_079140 [Virgisporangium aurantiacum]